MPASWAWPWSGAATLGLLGLAVAALAHAWATRPVERPRVAGLAAFLAAMLAMAAGVGWGRGWAGDRAGFQGRYVTLAAPFWCWLALVARLVAPPAAGGFFANGLFAAACLLFWPNALEGLEQARGAKQKADTLARDIRAGARPYQVVRRYTPFLHPSQDEAARLLPVLRRGRVGPFAALRDDPPFREAPLPLTPARTDLATWDAATSTARVTGVAPQITFRVDPPRPVAGLRIRYSHSNGTGTPARFQLTWKRHGDAEYSDARRYANWSQPTGDGVTTIWIDDVLAEFRIQPDNQPGVFRIDQIVLLEP